jgi:hypothetical protein
MKENIEYYTFALLQFCPILFAVLVILNNRETGKNVVLRNSIIGCIVGSIIGIVLYFNFIFRAVYTPRSLEKDLIDVLVIVLYALGIYLFFFGLFMAIFNPNQKKLGVIMIITSVILVVIGFGTCLANFSMGSMH